MMLNDLSMCLIILRYALSITNIALALLLHSFIISFSTSPKRENSIVTMRCQPSVSSVVYKLPSTTDRYNKHETMVSP